MPPSRLDRIRSLNKLCYPLLLIMAASLPSIGESDLAALAGIGLETSRTWLRSLEAQGYLERTARYAGYTLTESAWSLVSSENDRGYPRSLMQENVTTADKSALPPQSTPQMTRQNPRSTADIRGRTRQNPRSTADLSAVAPAESALAINDDDDDVLNNINNNNHHQQPTDENLAALAAAGINEPTRSRLAKLPHMTPDHITAWAEHVRRTSSHLRNSAGLLVKQLSHPYPPPTAAATQPARYTQPAEPATSPAGSSTDDTHADHIPAPIARQWAAIRRQLEAEMGITTWRTYGAPLYLAEATAQTWRIEAPAEDLPWLQARLFPTLSKLIPASIGTPALAVELSAYQD